MVPEHRLHCVVRPDPPAAGEGLRLGIWQGSGSAGTPEALEENLARLERVCELAAGHGVQLLAFPELYLTGYIVTPSIVRQLAEPVEGPSLRRVAAAARRHGLAVACPYAERATVAGEERFYDAIALFDKGGRLLRNYRKTHLWGPDEKRCWSAGYRHAEEGPALTDPMASAPIAPSRMSPAGCCRPTPLKTAASSPTPIAAASSW